ncbi:hypothetical protein HMPREF1986_01759 [Oribacterium sp. oral taxon 078 str. F0263]|nr:hypothetical protein GCWU000341_00627 [Oribacterium sp. oral taxon 078 str. F0262]ERL21008.1 hypothetical protein HMPREF1986_01759 [Oribacterium sp. oral taxon 078 str. F0263]
MSTEAPFREDPMIRQRAGDREGIAEGGWLRGEREGYENKA